MSTRVLFVAPSAYVLGGLATWLDYIAPGLRRRGWDVVVGLVEGPRYHRPETYVAEHPQQEWVAIPCASGTKEGRSRAMVRAIERTSPDLVVAVNIPDTMAAISRMRKSNGSSPRVAMAIHGIEPELYADVHRFSRALDGVVGVNRLVCRLAEHYGPIAPDRVHYAPCGVDTTGSDRQYACEDRLAIAWVGRIEQEQKRAYDIPEILQALEKRGVSFALTIAGSGPDEDALCTALESYVSAGHVRCLGRLDAAAVAPEVYAKADVLLLTSKWETGPIVVWEAMANRLAVVSSSFVGSRLEGALKDGHTALLFPIGEPEAAADALHRLWRDSSLMRHLAEDGCRMVEKDYSRVSSVERWDQALRSVLSSPALSDDVVTFDDAPASGRLDRWLGARAAETVRSVLSRESPDGGPGGEWPHAYGGTCCDSAEFWKVAEELDKRVN